VHSVGLGFDPFSPVDTTFVYHFIESVPADV
jgi:hypothetical protein